MFGRQPDGELDHNDQFTLGPGAVRLMVDVPDA